MLFWIMVGVVSAITLWVFVYYSFFDGYGDLVEGVLFGFLALLISGAVAGLILLAVGSWWMKPYVLDQRTDSYDLKALSNSETIEGQFRGGLFVSSGYVDGKQIFTYIQSEGDGYVLRQFDAGDAIVYQGDYDPEIKVTTYRWGNPWIFPFDRGETQSAEFYVPEGSVANTYEVTP